MSSNPQNASSREARLEMVLAEVLHARDAGQPVDRDAIVAAHPDLADELQSFFRNQQAVERLASPLRQVAPGDAPTLASSEQGLATGSPTVRYFGDYELLAEIARGGMGVVYKARQVSLNRTVAIKMILSGQLASDEDVQRFRHEAEVAANLDYPQIVPIYEVGEHEGQQYFSMKLIEGASLSEAIKGQTVPDGAQHAALTQRKSAELMSTVARAVHHAHQRGLLHRDLKPGNILLDVHGQPHVTDFGLAKRVEGASDMTRTGAIVGTPSYMAPEQAQGTSQLTTAADVYSLGAMLYELLAGRPPFRGETPLDTLLAVVAGDPAAPRSHNPRVDRELEVIALKCLEKDPAARYDSAAALADELDRWSRGEPILARAATRWQRVAKWARRKPAIAALTAAAILATTAGLTGTSIAAWRANVARREADERTVAERAARDAQAATLYINQIGRAYGEWQAGRSRQAVAILDSCRSSQRGWEWRYVRRLCAPDVGHYPLRSGRAMLVAYSPGGRYLAAAGEYQDLHLWDLQSGAYRVTPRTHALPIKAIAFSPDESRLASMDGQQVILWDVATAAAATSFSHSGHDTRLSYCPDGQRLLVGDDIRSAVDGAIIAKLPQGTYSGAWWSADGARLWAVSGDTMTSFDVATGQPVGTPVTLGDAALEAPLAVSPEQNRLIGLRQRIVANLWQPWVTTFDATTLKPLAYLGARPFTQRLDALTIAPNAALAAGAFSDSSTSPTHVAASLTVWDAVAGRSLATLFNSRDNSLYSPQFSPDGRQLAWAGGAAVQPWRLPTRREAERITKHPQPVCSVAWGGGTSRLVSLGIGDGLRVWERGTGRETQFVPVTSSDDGSGQWTRISAAVSPDGQTAAWISDFSVQVIELRPGAKPRALEVPSASDAFTRPVFSPDSKLLAAADANSVFVWNVASGKLDRRVDGYSGSLAVAFSSDGRRLAVSTSPVSEQPPGGGGQSIDVYPVIVSPLDDLSASPPPPASLESAQENQSDLSQGADARHSGPTTDQEHASADHDAAASPPRGGDHVGAFDLRRLQHGPARALAFSPDGRFLATGTGRSRANYAQPGVNSVAGEILIVDAVKGTFQRRLTGHTADITALAFTRDGQRLLSASEDGTVKVWSTAEGQEVLTLRGHAGAVRDLALSDDDAWLATAGGPDRAPGEILLWNATPLPTDFDLPILEYAAESTSSQPAVLEAPLPVVVEGFRGQPTGVAWRPDGRQIAVWGNQPAGPRTVELFDAQTGAPAKSLDVGTISVHGAAFSPDGARLAVGTHNDSQPGELILFDLVSGSAPQRFPGAYGGVAWRPDGAQLAVGAMLETGLGLQLRDASTGDVQFSLPGGFWAPSYSGDGRLVVAAIGKSVSVWNSANGQNVSTIETTVDWVRQPALSPDGLIVAAAGGLLENAPGSLPFWETSMGSPLWILRGHGGSFDDADFSRDGRWLATCSIDRAVKVWDCKTYQAQGTFVGHSEAVGSVSFGPDSRRIASTSQDGTVRIWTWTP